MAVRADRDLDRAVQTIRTVETGKTVAVGRVVKDGNADKECQHAGANELGFGVVTKIGHNTSVTAGAAGDRVTVAHLNGSCVIPVLVGTGGATRGKLAKVVSDGVTDATPLVEGGATTPVLVAVHGIFTQSGSAGDMVGMIPAVGYVTEE